MQSWKKRIVKIPKPKQQKQKPTKKELTKIEQLEKESMLLKK